MQFPSTSNAEYANKLQEFFCYHPSPLKPNKIDFTYPVHCHDCMCFSKNECHNVIAPLFYVSLSKNLLYMLTNCEGQEDESSRDRQIELTSQVQGVLAGYVSNTSIPAVLQLRSVWPFSWYSFYPIVRIQSGLSFISVLRR